MPARKRPAKVRIVPVTTENWAEFERFFSAKGSPHFCWCCPYRFRNAQDLHGDERKDALHGLVKRHTPVGVLAYVGEDAAGWCSVAPRETYVKLERSRTMPRVEDAATWTVLCFFVARPHRKSGVSLALLKGAVKYAKAKGAVFVEGYPHDTAGITSTHRGHSAVFKAARFKQDGARFSVGPFKP